MPARVGWDLAIILALLVGLCLPGGAGRAQVAPPSAPPAGDAPVESDAASPAGSTAEAAAEPDEPSAASGASGAPAESAASAAPAASSAGTPASGTAATAGEPPLGDDLVLRQQQVVARFRHFEEVLLRLAELTAAEDPDRAALLRKTVAASKERLVALQLENLVDLLEREQLARAVAQQAELVDDLVALLDLLLSEDRAKRREAEKEELKQFIREVNRLIKDQRGLHAQTEGQGSTPRLADAQDRLADKTGDLAGRVGRSAAGEAGEGGQGDDSGQAEDDSADRPSDDRPGDEQSPEGDDAGRGPGGDAEQGDSAPDSSAPDSEGRPGDTEKSFEPQDSAPQPSEGGEGQPGDSTPGEGSPQDQPPSGGESGQPGQSGQPSESAPGRETAQRRLEAAQQRMREAEQKLREAQRDDAAEKQAEALRELETAKAELEEILRQLREEEIQRMLAMLEARFRQMLKMQVAVYEGTLRLDNVPEDQRTRGTQIEAGRLSRQQRDILSEADKALALLHEEGSAVAFPEAVGQMRDDMEQVALWLAEVKVGQLTQTVEEDIIAALEEMIVALEKAQDELEQKQQQPPPEGGEPQDPPLIDQLAELKMIRSLQMRVNRRTQRYAELIDGEQAVEDDLLAALRELAARQDSIHRVTRDIVVGKNR